MKIKKLLGAIPDWVISLRIMTYQVFSDWLVEPHCRKWVYIQFWGIPPPLGLVLNRNIFIYLLPICNLLLVHFIFLVVFILCVWLTAYDFSHLSRSFIFFFLKLMFESEISVGFLYTDVLITHYIGVTLKCKKKKICVFLL